MIQLHSTEGTGRRKRAQRNALKRKRGNEDELVWRLENMLQSQCDSRQRKKPLFTTPGEEEAVAFDYLELKFHGNTKAGMFNVVADMSGGQGKPSRKSVAVLSFKTHFNTEICVMVIILKPRKGEKSKKGNSTNSDLRQQTRQVVGEFSTNDLHFHSHRRYEDSYRMKHLSTIMSM
jgi:hypothetical protein